MVEGSNLVDVSGLVFVVTDVVVGVVGDVAVVTGQFSMGSQQRTRMT